jgi:hypothetical protein
VWRAECKDRIKCRGVSLRAKVEQGNHRAQAGKKRWECKRARGAKKLRRLIP